MQSVTVVDGHCVRHAVTRDHKKPSNNVEGTEIVLQYVQSVPARAVTQPDSKTRRIVERSVPASQAPSRATPRTRRPSRTDCPRLPRPRESAPEGASNTQPKGCSTGATRKTTGTVAPNKEGTMTVLPHRTRQQDGIRDKTALVRVRQACAAVSQSAVCRAHDARVRASRMCRLHTLCCAVLRCATRRSASRVPRSIHTFIHSYIHSFIHSSIHSFIHSFIHTYIHTFIHSYIHTFIHSYIHTFM